MAKGTIKKVVSEKGFGFIEGERGDVFFHASAVQGDFDTIERGDTVEFEFETAEKGPRATSVKLCS